jgi:hypothetical protein
MYKMPSRQLSFEDDFFLPFGGKLRSDNRWVILAKSIPWDAIEEKYACLFSDVGQPAKPIRMAVGSLMLREKLQLSDEELVQQIRENHYLQFFLGFKSYRDEPPFDPSVLTKWRKRFTADILKDINRMIVNHQKESGNKPPEDGGKAGGGPKQKNTILSSGSEPTKNTGKMIIDATCAPADIKYPTDLGLLNDAREKTEEMIDILHAPLVKLRKKPRTYREKARKAYLSIAKQKRPKKNAIRNAIAKQLRYLKRNLLILQVLETVPGAGALSPRLQKTLSTIKRLYAQQLHMHQNKTHQVEDRIVSIHQPQVRPIIRGKANAFVEFGAKIELSVVGGYSFLETMSWDAYHEGNGLKEAIERYLEEYGCYPEAVLADRIYRTRENLRYCKEHGIRLSGPRLGPKGKFEDQDRKMMLQDNRERNAIEGKIGEGKRRYGLDLIMARLPETSGSVIAMQVLVMNLGKILRDLFGSIFDGLAGMIFFFLGRPTRLCLMPV